MPLTILLPLVVVGIAGLVLLSHLMGWTRRPAFASAEDARAAFLADYPDAYPDAVALSADRRAALLAVDGAVGFAERFGDGRVTRLFRRGDLAAVAGEGRLRIETRDFALPVIEIELAEDAGPWRARLSALTGGSA